MNAIGTPMRRIADAVYPWPRADAAPLFRYGLHLAFWSLLLLALWQINRLAGVDHWLRSPWPWLHRVWLPLLAIALYPVGWLARALWSALEPPATSGAWPELEAAWADARRALHDASIDPRATPVFLVLGPVTYELQTHLQALGAAPMPLRPEAPFQLYAHAPAIFLALPCDAPSRAQPEPTPIFDLCRLILAERRPGQPLQGIIVTVPLEQGESAAVAASLRASLGAVRQATGLELPIFFAITGIDPALAGEPCSLALPPLPDLDPAETALMYQRGLDWLILERVPRLTRERIRLDTTALVDNIRLFRRQIALANWRTHLGRLMSEATRTDDAEPGMVAGCYFIPPAGQAAAPATLQADLLAAQHAACWTAATVEQVESQARRVRLGYALAALAILAALGCIIAKLISG